MSDGMLLTHRAQGNYAMNALGLLEIVRMTRFMIVTATHYV